MTFRWNKKESLFTKKKGSATNRRSTRDARKNVCSNKICVIIKLKLFKSNEKVSMQLLHGMKVKTHSKEPQVLLYIRVQMK
jgi:hypothetical protein